MKKNLDWIRTHKTITMILIIIILLFLLIAIPLFINESYKKNSGYITMWGASDVLSFYGACLGAVATIISIIITMNYAEKTRKKDFYNQLAERKLNETIDLINKLKKLVLYSNDFDKSEFIVQFYNQYFNLNNYLNDIKNYCNSNQINLIQEEISKIYKNISEKRQEYKCGIECFYLFPSKDDIDNWFNEWFNWFETEGNDHFENLENDLRAENIKEQQNIYFGGNTK